jgi:VWFA-related protein
MTTFLSKNLSVVALVSVAVGLLATNSAAGQSSASPATSSSAASGPAPQTPVTTLKVQAREVILPVTVRDKKGAVVANLKMDDFTLQEDGRPQVIKSFSHETNLPFRLGLLVDTSRSMEGAIPGERTATGKFIDQMLSQPADKAFLLHFDHEVELLQDFTASKTKLHHELDDMKATTSSGEGSGGDSGSRGDGDSGEGHRRRGGGTQMYDAIYLASNELMLKEQGRKAVILLSDGVDRGSKESLNDAIDAAEKANVSVYTVYFKGEEEHSGGGFPGMGRGGGGGGYPGGGGGYPGGGRRGGQRPTGSSEPKVDGKKIMEQIAARTGGVFFEAKKKDSFDEVFGQIGEELHGQYLLTYTPDKPADSDDADGFHKILLKAKDEKLTVITREGYYAQK